MSPRLRPGLSIESLRVETGTSRPSICHARDTSAPRFGNAARAISRARQLARPARVAAHSCCSAFAADRSGRAFRACSTRVSAIQSPFGVCCALLRAEAAARLESSRIVAMTRAGSRISKIASSAIAAARRRWFRGSFLSWSRRFGRSIRCGRGAKGGKPAGRVPTQQSARQIELIENNVAEQSLAMKVPSRLRVICATPIQKRRVGHRSERFLYCVCRNLR